MCLIKLIVEWVEKCKIIKNYKIMVYLKNVTRKINKYIENKSGKKYKKW